MAKKKAADEKKVYKKLSKEETEKLVLEMAKKGMSSAKIGLVLKKEYGVPKAKYVVGKIEKLLVKNKMGKQMPEELSNMIDKAKKLRKHFEKNKKDMSAKRGILVVEAKIRKRAAYFRKKKMLSGDWEYKAE